MPALFTRISRLPNPSCVFFTMPATWSGLLKSAPSYRTFTENSAANPLRSFSISPASPKPFSMISAPSAASARAIPSPIPLVEPVTNATLPFNAMGDPPLFRFVEIVVQHFAIGQRQIRAEMLPVMNFPYRQIRQTAIRVRHEMQSGLAGISKFQIDIFQIIPDQLRNFWAAIHIRNKF